MPRSACWPTPSCGARAASGRRRCSPGSPPSRRWPTRASRIRMRPRWRSGSARCCSPRARRPAPARWPAWPSCSASTWVWPPRSARCCSCWPGVSAPPRCAAPPPRRSWPRCSWRRSCSAPRDELWDQTVGFALDEQSLQRLPLPGAWEGGFEPSALLHFYFPYVLLGGLALWLGLALATRAPLRLWVALPLALAGLAYLLARADEFHQAPLAVALAVLLGSAVAREREQPAPCRRPGARGRAGADRPARAGPQAGGGVQPAAAGDARRCRRPTA